MWIIKTLLQAFGIFAVSIVILTVIEVANRPRHVATGLAALKSHGVLLMGVGLWYVAFAVFLLSPAPEQLFKQVLRRWFGVQC